MRKAILVLILVMVAMGSYLTRVRATDWEEPLWVGVYPINGDGGDRTERYLGKLSRDIFLPAEKFMAREAARFGVDIAQPLRFDLGDPVSELPPPPPTGAGMVGTGLWSLKMRWWAYRATRNQTRPTPDVRMFLVYYDPETSSVLPHSLGLSKGMLGVANVFATRHMAGSNNVVIAHEILHTLGASDKYGGANDLPLYPDGYAEPDQRPRYPQSHAEIMGGRIPITATRAEIPRSLEQVRVGMVTAKEIRWSD